MKIQGQHYRTIWLDATRSGVVQVIDQSKLPFEFLILDLKTSDDAARAIKDMIVRGAGLIGATAGYGMYLGALEAVGQGNIEQAKQYLTQVGEKLKKTRPTAVNLAWAVDRQWQALASVSSLTDLVEISRIVAVEIADEDAECCKAIGQHGVEIIKTIHERNGGNPVQILTHCNAGWLAFVDYGSATAPIYAAHDLGIPVHVWVDETRPRNQGARLTAWELQQHGVPHRLIVDNVGGHLMQHHMVDMVIVGTDRTTASGDVANKIGTYLKALAAKDNNVPFYVALPSSTFDWTLSDGVREIPIEERDATEVLWMEGVSQNGQVEAVRIAPEGVEAANYGFDVTPARLITGLITERGICQANRESIAQLFPDKVVTHG